MALISKSTINEVNNRLDAVSVISEHVRLEKKSGRFWGKCPFHAGGAEKTPSFTVDPDLKLYHCFGCNKGGSVISFVMEMDNLTYPEAIKILARKTGTEIVYEEGTSDFESEDTTHKEQLYELYKRLTETFIYFLDNKQEGKNAKKYLLERGINEDMIKNFKLGYSPTEREFLYKFLKQKGYSEDFLAKSGLFSKNYKTISLFTGRLIFPIADRQGKIVAFGGRMLPSAANDKDSPKYINSPETEIYKKGQTLFALDLAKSAIRNTKTAVLAEGYMDVIALHQAGITNAVAPLGTAFTDEQANWLSRWVEKATLIFDTDEAGIKAAFKSILICRKNGIRCEVVNLNKGINMQNLKDPADILLKFGQEMLKNAVKSIIFDFEYIISISGGKNKMAEYIFPFLSVLKSEIERDDCISQIAERFRIEKKAVEKDYQEWDKKNTAYRKNNVAAPDSKAQEKVIEIKRNYELVVLTVTALNMELYPEFRKDIQIKEIDDRAAKELFVSLEECFVYGEMTIDSLLSRIKDNSLKNFIINSGSTDEFKGENAQKLMEDGIKEIKKKRYLKRLTEISAEIRALERDSANNLEAINKIDELLSEKKQLDDKIRKDVN